MPEKKTKSTAAKSESAKTSSKKESFKAEEVVKDLEKKAEAVGAKTDKAVDELVEKVGFIDKLEKASWVKEILNLSFMNSANKWVRKNLETICKILGWIYLILGIILGITAIIAFFVALVALFTGAFGAFFEALLAFASVVLMIMIGRGFIKMKKRTPAILIISILLDLVLLIINIFKGANFGINLLQIILNIIFTLFVIKNKDMFKN